MRNLLFLIVCVVLSVQSYSQQDVSLPGEVVEQNSKFNTGSINYLSNVQIKAPGATPLHSDAKGKFTLVFVDKLIGNVTRVYASKDGYEVVNDEELKKAAVLGRKVPLKVVLCEEGQLYENQIVYYKIARDAVLAAHKQRIAILQKAGKERELLLARMRVEHNQEIKTIVEAIQLLERQKDSAVKEAKELADKFVTVNLDDQTETYQRAFRAFLAKDIDRALRILDSVDLEDRLSTAAEANKKDSILIESRQQKIAKRKEQIQQDINQCVFKARLHILKYEFNKADSLFELALQYVPTDGDILFEFSYYLQKQNQFEKALTYYSIVLQLQDSLAQKNPDAYLPTMARTLNNLGVLLMDYNEMQKAKQHLRKALQIRRELAKKNPDVYLPDVAATLYNLGRLLRVHNEMQKAKQHFQNALQLYRSLATKCPDLYLPYVAITLHSLGVLSADHNEMKQARQHLEEALKIRRELAKKSPDLYLPDVAATLNSLGVLYADHNELKQAKQHLEEALKIRREFAKKNPDVYLPDVAVTLNNFSGLLRTLNERRQAKQYYQEALKIRRELAKKNPDVYLPDVAAILNNLGVVLMDDNEMPQAEQCYQEALRVYRNLAQNNPDVYLPYVATTLNNLGILFKDSKEMRKAKQHYREALEVYQGLAKKNPKVYNLDVCMTAINLALYYEKLLVSTGDIRLKQEGIQLIEDARLKLSIFADNHPEAKQYRSYLDRLLKFFSDFTVERFQFNQIIDSIELLRQQNETEADINRKILRQRKIIDLHYQLEEYLPDNKDLVKALASEHSNLAWYLLFDQQFAAAEETARKGLSLDQTAEWINTNLAPSLLYQNKFEAAKFIYLQFKDQPQGDSTYSKVFLEDLDALEKEGITHPDAVKIRQLLGE